MSLDQCHSSVGEQPVIKPRAIASTDVGVNGKAYVRGLEDVADTRDFRDLLEREFPSGASRLLESSRRTFLKLMGASVALAGAATLPGCRRPDHKIYSYSKDVPESIVPGKATFYATTLALPGGRVEGILCETHEGRPTKIEGNPLHEHNQGRASSIALASILSLYDPDRLKDPKFLGMPSEEERQKPRSWADFAAWCSVHFPTLRGDASSKLAFVVDAKRSPSRDRLLKDEIKKKFPKAMWVSYDPTASDAASEGASAAFGKPMRDVLDVSKAEVIASFDRDILLDDAAFLSNTRGFASKRTPKKAADEMNRLYVVEGTFSTTGAKADHRVRVAPSEVGAYVAALAAKLGEAAGLSAEVALGAERLVNASGVKIDEQFVAALAEDLLRDENKQSRKGKSLVLVGASQPAAIHALGYAINAALGNIGSTLRLKPLTEEERTGGIAGLKRVTDALNGGQISTLVCINTNPAYDAPGDLGFAEAMKKAQHRITLSSDHSETIEHSTWQLPLAHALESWGDLESLEGTLSPVQPMIAPLFGAKSDLEVLAHIAGLPGEEADGYTIVRNTWKANASFAKSDFERAWRRALNDGVFSPSEKIAQPTIAYGGVASALRTLKIASPGSESLDVVFVAGSVGDGSLNNNAWLQELPDPMTKIVWDNVALVSPATAKTFGIEQDKDTSEVRHARLIDVSVGGQTVRAAAWAAIGIPDNTIVMTFGYGRTHVGRVGEGTGHNVYPISGLGGSNRRMATGAKISRVSGGETRYPISCTQSHGSMEGRAIVRETDLPAWKKFGDDPFAGMSAEAKARALTDSYKQQRDLNYAERLGELSHTPANANAYINPQRGTKTEAIAGSTLEHGSSAFRTDGKERAVDFARDQQWGMTLDMSSCTGCSACVVACQSENNIPVVGKIEVNKHREMHWMRIDRYYAGDNLSGGITDASVTFQPLLCVHCENAPCETVCPVNATVHGPEGINYMVYNRCIGTRYCANNCPYKVRRFNFFDYGVKKFNGDYIGQGAMDAVGLDPKNKNLIPPRLRERLDEVTKLGMNPNVTIRSRGVMEKCSYCIQRINEARIEVKLKKLDMIPDGFFQTACQQSCPADAITFGDINDVKTSYPLPGGGTRMGSKVHELRESQRSYMVLGYLNTRPRTTHLMVMRNPNPALVTADRRNNWTNPFDHHHGDHSPGHEGHEAKDGKHAFGPAQDGAKSNLVNFIDQTKSTTDTGYRLSLGVLPTAGGV
ncbi:MAG: TAT-variant-translocated molybdopterin oxidoreductase [Phycisphaerales bacterium]|nr:TAT-variant-translocated molybdopterin oxidoreductase [Phycisphaerales bacterium]